MGHRCTNCGRYPFCYWIIIPSIENECDQWIKRSAEEITYKTLDDKKKGEKKDV